MTRLAWVMARHRAALIFDLRRFLGVSVGDVVAGRVPLSEAALLVGELVKQPGSSIARDVNDDEPPWVTSDYLLAHVYQALTGEEHPALPKERRSQAMTDPARMAALNRARARAAERQRRIEAGELT